MKRTLILLGILMLLLLAYFFFTKGDGTTSSIRMEDREFITKDPSEVKTITIKSKARPSIHLSRKNNTWMINGKYKASENVTGNMLMALSKMSIKYIPQRAENETAKKRMEKFGIDIVTYDGDGNVLTELTLGPNISTEYGTYVRKKGAEQIYVMQMQATEGALVAFFNHTVIRMRSLNVIDIPSDEINSVSVDYPKNKVNSFVLNKQDENFSMTLPLSGEEVFDFNNNLVDAYFKDFENLNAENFLNEIPYKDSITTMLPFVSIALDLKKGDDVRLDLYPFVDLTSKYVTRSVDDITTRHQIYYVKSSWGDMYHVQRKFVTKLLRKPAYFKG